MKSVNTRTVNPDKFKVPYAIDNESKEHDLKDIIKSKQTPDVLFCPICLENVFFVNEIEDKRSAHFRHSSRSECDRIYEEQVKTIHNRVVAAAARMLRSDISFRDMFKQYGQEFVVPTGEVFVEKNYTINGKQYRPDVSIEPAKDQIAPVVEMEVILTHPPEKPRLKAAAEKGHLIASIDIAELQKQYNTLKRGELQGQGSFNLDDVCERYILQNKFKILSDRDIKQGLRKHIRAKLEYLRAARPKRMEAALPPASEPWRAGAPNYNPTPPPKPAPAPVPKPPELAQVCLTGDVTENANTVLDELRNCTSPRQIDEVLQKYRDAIEAIRHGDSVRVIHIHSLAHIKRIALNPGSRF